MLGCHVRWFFMVPMHMFIYLISISCVIKMNVCLRILFMKKSRPKMKVACLFLSSSAATKPQLWLVMAILNTTCYTSQLGLCGPSKACTSERPHPNRLSRHSKNYVFPSTLQSDFNGRFCTLGDHKYDKDPAFRKFKQQLYHSSILAILSTLKPAMLKPAVYHCPDGHFCCVIFGIGPFITNYPEQVFFAGIKQGWCPRCIYLSFCSSFHLLIPS